MKIKIWSDLHFEHWRRYGEPDIPEQGNEDVLVLAGDIDNYLCIERTLERICNSRNTPVIYVAGNHEYYGTNTSSLNARVGALAGKLENLVFLDGNLGYHKDGVCFYGSTLWTNFDNNHMAELAARDLISDFRYINKFGTDSCKKLHDSQFGKIKMRYENRNRGEKQVIVTHFLPAFEVVHPMYKGPGNDYLNKYFSCNHGEWISELDNTTWIFGHTHMVTDVTIGTTRCVCNPCGYPREKPGNYNWDYTITI